MAKEEFNLSAAIRESLGENPNASASETMQAIQTKHPKQKINKGSFSVCFYTTRQKMGVGGVRKSRGKKIGIRKSGAGIDLTVLTNAARFLREAGSVENAIAAIKSVQAVQIS